MAPHCFAAQIIVAWDANSEPEIAGYKVHYGTTSGIYEYIVDVGNTTSCSISGLTEGTTYYIAATAYNINNVESNFSEELVHTVQSGTPSITTPVPGSILPGSTATFSWSANGASVSEWWLYVGSSFGESDIYDSGSLGSSTSTTVNGLPTDGSTVYVRLWYFTGGSWEWVDVQCTAFDGGGITNNPPTVSITSPLNGASFDSGAIISFEGTASDNEDGDLTGGLVWASDLQGQIANVGSFSTVLSDGTHTITAEVTDSGNSTASDSITITVGGGSGDDTTIMLTAVGKQNKKWLIIKLDWSGATSTDVDIWRDGAKIATTSNGGAYTDKMSNDGGRSYTYQVCEAGTFNCSNETTVNF